jgi:hypothetical protein
MDQVALMDVLPPSEPGSPHTTTLEGMGEGSLDDLGAASHALLTDLRAQAVAVGVDGVACRLITVPAGESLSLRLGNPGLPGAVVEVFQDGAGVVALVGDEFGRLCRRRLPADACQVRLRRLQGALERRCIALMRRVNLGRDHRTGVEIDGVFRLVGGL